MLISFIKNPLSYFVYVYFFNVLFFVFNRNLKFEYLVGVQIWISAVLLSFAIIKFYSSDRDDRFSFTKALKDALLFGRKGKLAVFLHVQRMILISYGVWVFITLGTEMIWVSACLFFINIMFTVVLSIELYRKVQRRLRWIRWSIVNALIIGVFSIAFFVAQMFASQLSFEYIDVAPNSLYYSNKALSILLGIFIICSGVFASSSLLSELYSKRHNSFRKGNQRVVRGMVLIVWFPIIVLFFIILSKIGVIGSYILSVTYPYDSRTSFRCGEEYQTIVPLGPDARYISVSEAEYRAIFMKDNDVYVVVVKCLENGRFTWFPVKTAHQINGGNNR